MSERGVEIKVGALLIVGMVVLFLGYTWYSGYKFRNSGYHVRVLFSDVTGLQVGDDVRVAGVKKGRVKSIKLEGKAVEVVMRLPREVKLYKDAGFAIMDVALISGTKYIAVMPGTSSVALDLDERPRGKPSAAFAMNKIVDLSESVNELVTVLRKNLFTDEAITSAKETVENLNALTKNLAVVLDKSGRDLATGVNAFKSASIRLDSLLGSEEFTNTVARLDTLTRKMSTGEGSLAKLLNDPDAYDEMKGTLKAAKELLEDIKAHPRKYINLELF